MQLHHRREERVHLRELVDRELFGESLARAEEATILDLWRSAEHHPLNSKIDAGQGVRLITSGWAGWLRCADDGRRLIFLFLMPGDFIIPGLFTAQGCDVVSLTPVRTVDATPLIDHEGLTSPRASAIIEGSGRRYRHLLLDHMSRLMIGSTTSGLALLLIEFYERSVRSGACDNGKFSFPIGQRMIAAALGRSAVQVNKVMSSFKADGLIQIGYDWLEIKDYERLRSLTGLDGTESVGLIPIRPAAFAPICLVDSVQ